jgi:hypothetical protein
MYVYQCHVLCRTGQVHYMEFLAATLEARGFIEEEKLLEVCNVL